MNHYVWIPRALDGSWQAIASSNEEALRLIAEREPDEHKRSGYQILVEPASRVPDPNFRAIGVRDGYGLEHAPVQGRGVGFITRLAKWDGEGPVPDDAAIHPMKYSRVSEVIEFGDGIPTRVLYRR